MNSSIEITFSTQLRDAITMQFRLREIACKNSPRRNIDKILFKYKIEHFPGMKCLGIFILGNTVTSFRPSRNSKNWHRSRPSL